MKIINNTPNNNPKYRPIGLGHVSGIMGSIRHTTGEVEYIAHSKADTTIWVLKEIYFYAALKVFGLHLITIDSVFTCCLSMDMTMWIYYGILGGDTPYT
jgi:hypothetical protein